MGTNAGRQAIVASAKSKNGNSTNRTSSFNRVHSFAFSIMLSCLVLSPLSIQPAMAAQDAEVKAKLTAIEQRLFSKAYGDDDAMARLVRIEKRIFGDAGEGSFDERYARVVEITAPQLQQAQEQEAPPAQPQSSHQQNREHQRPVQEDPEEAMERNRLAAMQARDEEVTKLLADGVSFWKSRRKQEALEKFEQAIRLDPQNAEAHYSLGIIYEAGGNFVEALSSYKLAYQNNPDNKEYKQAIAMAEKKAAAKQVQLDAQAEVRVMHEEATSAFKRGEFLSALELYKRLDEKFPKQHQVKYSIGNVYLMMKSPIQALEYYQQARKLKPDEQRYITACTRLEGNIQQDQQQLNQAKAAWDDPQDANSANNKRKKKPKKNENQGNPNPSTAQFVDPRMQQQQQQQQAPRSGGGMRQGQGDPMSSFGIIAAHSQAGVTVTTVGIGSRAAKAGLKRGDIILAVDGTQVNNTNLINDILSRKQQGESAQLLIKRGEQIGQVIL